MINIPYEADCYIRRNENGKYKIVCDFFANNKWTYAKYSGNDFTEGLNSIIASLESKLEKEEPTVEEKYAGLKKENEVLKNENETLKNKLNVFTSIENNFEKKLNEVKPVNSTSSAAKEDPKKVEVNKINSVYDSSFYEFAEKFMKKIEEDAKDMTGDEYFNYVMKMFGLK